MKEKKLLREYMLCPQCGESRQMEFVQDRAELKHMHQTFGMYLTPYDFIHVREVVPQQKRKKP